MRFYGLPLLLVLIPESNAFLTPTVNCLTKRHVLPLSAAPDRLEDNTDGVLYVNSKCINCQACNQFAPTIFDYSPKHAKYVVKKQPTSTSSELENARAALSACPVAAIRVENSAQRNHVNKDKLTPAEEELANDLVINPKVNQLPLPFPRRLAEGVYYLGHHDHKSFGAVPYLVTTGSVCVMVDTPKFSPSAVRAVESLCGADGPEYLFLTHVDDVGDHGKWKERYPRLKRIFHEGDLGRHNWIGDLTLERVEILLRGGSGADDLRSLKTWNLEGEEVHVSPDEDEREFTIIHTPGHSPGSICLLYRNRQNERGVLFTGDTLGYSNRIARLTGFPRYGNDLKKQSDILAQLIQLPLQWDIVAPGHGKCRDYSNEDDGVKDMEVMQAIKELQSTY
mmetsp:Transcript_33726/g.41347  ORF Transcript_33726/g.41347 Transcript_33726/m.41347 type:complete len:394 (+) Transcript_33726:26-1207(+)|eukprot:CAMPEP_0172496922 /NCGR_PEP_ID=MMETSP1066-20121228/94688_1 /TAXON_ID=671091 /ORGANISM="Coscinodiscus wailesii, Strain CCMP2513" /LENGTH=393 /DNA_ID=CAMNT_0013269473 /DNA_START=26 /DNA_END=1207 /DNA_ORIENTATION=+